MRGVSHSGLSSPWEFFRLWNFWNWREFLIRKTRAILVYPQNFYHRKRTLSCPKYRIRRKNFNTKLISLSILPSSSEAKHNSITKNECLVVQNVRLWKIALQTSHLLYTLFIHTRMDSKKLKLMKLIENCMLARSSAIANAVVPYLWEL